MMKYNKPGLLLDTSISTLNLGDEIIVDSVRKELTKLVPNKGFFRAAAQEKISIQTYKVARKTDSQLVCGTNLLSGNMPFYKQWKIDFFDTYFLKNICLVGVGWWQYQDGVNLYSKLLLRKALNNGMLHSVRDNYTKEKLESIGIKNVLNTSCATMWSLTPEHCSSIPSEKSNSVVFTITDYRPDSKNDSDFINVLTNSYDNVYFWPQGSADLKYYESLNLESKDDIMVLPFSLEAYDRLLEQNDGIDFIGTRLHAGIRALQFKRKSLILAVDNRAEEKRKDFNLPVIARDDISAIKYFINNAYQYNINLPIEEIDLWKSSFLKHLSDNRNL
ncbi:polysaccharide pyruvyl transferase family protein [Vibrio jasicida]|uniref:polysaccharide pyruvyl transferase family protein n=1 Tax=Vibrio jasicida TaxID=766224 RepID=UPI004067632D